MNTAAVRRLTVIDSHTGGEPTRVVVAGGPDLGCGPLPERVATFRTEFDHYRSAVVQEPRGSDVVVGAMLVEPVDRTCAAGVIFFNNVGLPGHVRPRHNRAGGHAGPSRSTAGRRTSDRDSGGHRVGAIAHRRRSLRHQCCQLPSGPRIGGDLARTAAASAAMSRGAGIGSSWWRNMAWHSTRPTSRN